MKLPPPLVALGLLFPSASVAQVAPGFAQVPTTCIPGFDRELEGGDFLSLHATFANVARIHRWAADGSFVENVAEISVEGGVDSGHSWVISPDESRGVAALWNWVAGEEGWFFSIDLESGEYQELGTFTREFRVVFETASTLLVVTDRLQQGDTDGETYLVRYDLDSGESTLLGIVRAGALAMGPAGELYFSTEHWIGAPDGSVGIGRFTAEQLRGEELLLDRDAEVVLRGLDFVSHIHFEPVAKALLFVETDFDRADFQSRIRRVELDDPVSGQTVFTERKTFNTLRIEPSLGESAGFFHPFQPTGAASLRVRSSNSVEDQCFLLSTRRPELTADGPGVGGIGEFELAVTGGPPDGFAVLAAVPLATWTPDEVPFLVGGLPLVHTGMDLSLARVVAPAVALDEAGAASFGPFFNHAGVVDALVFQALLLGTDGDILGSTTALSF